MDHYRESYPGLIKSASLRMEGAKSIAEPGNNRRVLGDIDINNFIRVRPPSPSRVAKRGISENSFIKAKNKVDNRPVTRRFAASLANKSGHENHNPRAELIKNEKHKNTMTTFPSPTGFESFTVIDLDEDVEVSPLPSFVKHTEAMLEEMESLDNFELEEVEMAEIEEEDEPVPDIDSGDKRNPLATVEYVEEIYSFYRSSEGCSCVRPNYMSNQSDINEKMRAILIDWLIEVHYKFELMHETLFLTVNLIDRFLERQFVVRKKLQLVGVTAMLLACKYEEVTVPVVDDLILISDRAYSREEVLAMEKLMVNTLQFHISVPTPYVFLRRFLKAAQADKKLELLTFFMIELCLVEYGMLKYPPSLLAAGAVYTALCTLNRFKHWSRACQWHTNYTEDQLLECSSSMVNFHQKAATGKLTGVHKKYSTYRFGYAARAEPAQFLLQVTL